MTVFHWLVALLLLAALFLQGNVKGNKKFIFVAFLLLFAVMGLRDVQTGGGDSSGVNGSYPIIYEHVGNEPWGDLSGRGEQNYNIGFEYFAKAIYQVTDGDYQMFISILSFFILFSYLRFIRRYSPSPIQSVLYFLGLMYFTFMFDALKQALAMSVLLFAFDAIIEKRPLKFIIIVLIAAQLHFPALVFLPTYWIGRMKIGRSYLILLGILLLATYLFRDQLLNLMLDAYGNDEIEGSMEGIRFLRNKSIVMIVIVAAAVFLRPPTAEDKVYNACLILAGIAIVFQTFCGYNNIFERLADYYFHTSILLIPLVFENHKQEKHYLNVVSEARIKSAAPYIFCSFAIWRFISTITASTAYSGIRFLWQGHGV